MTFLNHGAFGATPRRVLAAQRELQTHMERQPLRFFVDEAPGLIRAAAASIADFVGADADDVALVENTTAGVSAVLQSFPLQPGDRVLASTHLYPAVDQTLRFMCAQRGAHLDLADVPCPVGSPDEIVHAFAAAITPQTKLLVVDHVTSLTALIFPVERLVALARQHGLPILVDGAHAPGMLPLDLPRLEPTWYVGNCHKWLCAPKGAALLWANPRHPLGHALHSPVVSHLHEQPFPAGFDWIGTRDVSAWLSLPAALEFRAWLGDAAVRAWNQDFAKHGAHTVADAVGGTVTGPDSMIGAIGGVVIPGFEDIGQDVGDALRLALWREERIEVPFPVFAGALCVRISGQVYNDRTAAEQLARVLPKHLARAKANLVPAEPNALKSVEIS